MGFNFGAFAAGAIKGAGDLVEKQHKETKDTIDSNMKFAYEQGLPFHRQRMKDKKRFEGYASTLQNMQLGADQISVVMGKSEDFIKDFIVKSTAEKESRPDFDIPSQVIVKNGGNITDWRNVQLGTIDLPKVNRQTQSSNSSLLGSMLGTNRSSGNSTGFNNLVDKTRAQMESITGTSYADVAAAGQQAYSYEQGSEGTVNIVNTSAQLNMESKQLQVQYQREMNPLNLATAQWNATNRETVAERAAAQDEFDVLKRKWAKAAGEYRFESGLDNDQVDEQIALIEESVKTRAQGGPTPEAGLYSLHLAIAEEMALPEPDQEKLAKLQSSKLTIGIFLGERAAQTDGNSNISFGQWNSSYNSRVDEILALTVDAKNPAWYSDGRGVRQFNFNLNQSKEAGKQAKAQATSEFIESIRELKAAGRPISSDLQQWLVGKRDFDIDLVNLDTLPENPEDIQDDKMYAVFSLKIPIGSVQDADENGKFLPTYSYPPKAGYSEQSDGAIPRYPLPKFATWSKRTGAQQKNQLNAKASSRVAREQVTVVAAAPSKLSTKGSMIGNPEDRRTFVSSQLSLNIDRKPNEDVKRTHNDMFRSLVSPGSKPDNMTIDVYKEKLLNIIENTTNGTQMEQAIKVYDSLEAQ
jgi:hypothetical protein